MPRAIAGVPTSVCVFAGRCRRGPVGRPVPVSSFASFERTFGGPVAGVGMGHAVRDFFLNGGTRALILRIRAAGARRGLGGALAVSDYLDAATGLSALGTAEGFNLLCVPPDRNDADIPDAVHERAAAICAGRRAIYVADPPLAWTSAERARAALADFPAAFRAHAANVALYFPRIITRDPLRRDAPIEVAPCGAVAGVIARTDGQRGVWKAPAGADATLLGVEGLAVTLSDASQALLNPLALNCLRQMPGIGHVVWGARTLAGRDDDGSREWTYLPVRRLGLYIEESVERGTDWAVFEPNDEPLWARIRNAVGAFMDGLFRAGALQGARASDAWFVKCGTDTMTAADIANGNVNIAIGFAPLRPAEFIVVRIGRRTAAA